MNLTERFQKQVFVFLEDLQTALPYAEIESRFRAANVLNKSDRSETFQALLRAYLTAQLAQRWNYCCLDLQITVKEIQNLFFKTVMDRYAAEKRLDDAAAFSEAMYAANSKPEEPSLFMILIAFFKKMNMQDGLAVPKTAELCRWLAGVMEAYSNHFDNEFDDFVGNLRLEGDLGKLLKRKK